MGRRNSAGLLLTCCLCGLSPACTHAPQELKPTVGTRSFSAQELTPVQLKERLETWLQSTDPFVIEGTRYQKCIAFDADGTLWREDLLESLVDDVIAHRRIHAEALEPLNAVLRRYSMPEASDPYDAVARLREGFQTGSLKANALSRGLDEDGFNREIWPTLNLVFVGWTEAEVEEATAALLQARFEGQIYEGWREVLEMLRHYGVRTVVVSAGLEPAVRVGAAKLGFAGREVAGQRSRLLGGRLTGEIELPVLYGDGKVERAHDLCGGRPWLAFGDSVVSSDRRMLQDAGQGLAVEPGPRHLARARQEGFWIVNFQATVNGTPADKLP
jgi:phosphoserine phosphatase